jgi:hypothetical protein
MLEYRQTYALVGVCEQYGISLPDYLVAARLTHDQPTELAAWMRFSRPLMEALRAPFDTAATAHMGGDQTALPTLCALGQIRDLLAEGWPPPITNNGDVTALRVRSQADGGEFEKSIRVLDVGSVIMAESLLPCATRGTTRLSPAWFAAVLSLSINGLRIKWQTPTDQVAMDWRLPVTP